MEFCKSFQVIKFKKAWSTVSILICSLANGQAARVDFHMVTCQPLAPALQIIQKNTNLFISNNTKCKSALLYWIWILAFCLCNSSCFSRHCIQLPLFGIGGCSDQQLARHWKIFTVCVNWQYQLTVSTWHLKNLMSLFSIFSLTQTRHLLRN